MIYAYTADNPDFDHIGNTSLIPTEAYTESELNGTWTARLAHPIDPEGRWKFIEPGGVIKMPSWNGDQLYRIINRLKENDYVTCVMYPIFFDSMNDLFLVDVAPTNATGQQALTAMLQGSQKYSATSDITTRKSARYQMQNFMQAIAGDEERSFLSIWGGEVEYDNFTVKVNTVLGADNGLTIRYGLNLQGVQEEVDTSEMLTRVYAQAYNGRPMSGSGYVDSPLIASYPTVKTGVVVFDNIKAAGDATEEDESDPAIIICRSQAQLDTALTNAVNAAFDGGLDKPRINVALNGMVDLSKIQGFAGLVNPIGLGDVAHLTNKKLGIETDARVVYIKYDSIRKMAADIQIGTKQLNLFQSMSDAQVQTATAYKMAESSFTKATNTESLLTSGAADRYLRANGAGNDPTWENLDDTYVPNSRKVNNKALSSDITLNASDVGAVPTSRTVNGKALGSNISLTAADVGALANNGATSATNLNSLTDTGVYIYSSSASNTPTNANGTLLVLATSANYIYQMAFANNSAASPAPNVYARLKNSGGWGAWASLI